MKIYGEFINTEGRRVNVEFNARNVSGEDIIIGEERTDGRTLYFADESAVTTECSFNDSMDVILSQSASVQLQSEGFAPWLSGRGFRDVEVGISVDGKCVFYGFLEPNTYNQPFVDVLDDLELNCVDVLASLQYRPFRGIGGKTEYKEAVAAAKSSTFWELIRETLDSDRYTILYDGSKRTATGTAAGVFKDLKVSDLVFLGDDEDDVWTYQDILEALLKYLNLHIVQEGMTFYIFSWESVRAGNITWINLSEEGKVIKSEESSTPVLRLTNGMAGDADGEITLSEAFNKLSLKVSPKSIDELVTSPLDDLDSAYPHRALYCREYRAHYLKEFKAFLAKGADPSTLLTNGTVKDGYWIDWYMLVKRNENWLIGRAGKDMVDTFKTDDYRQENIANQLALYPGAALISLGCVKNNDSTEKDGDKKDNSPKSSLDMSDYLVISVAEADAGDTTYDPLTYPLAEYVGSNGGAVYSPPDAQTTNYIVISGMMRLEKKEPQSITVRDYADAPIGMYREALANGLKEQDYYEEEGGISVQDEDIRFKRVKSQGHADSYLEYKWYRQGDGKTSFGTGEDLNPQGTDFNPANWPPEVKGHYSNGLRMPSEFDAPDFEYQYSRVGSSSDTLSKVPVLECMLVIGGKVLVEDMSMDGKLSALTWRTFKDLDICRAAHPNDEDAALDEYFAQTFSIGFDPKIGDHLLNEDHEVQTNFTWELGIDTDKGMAIPIKYSDHLNGSVKFRILGVVNSFYYDKITRRHRTWFRSEKWRSEAVPLMANVRNIFIKDFAIKLYSNNSMTDNSGDNDGDMVYMSDTDESFFNKKDDLEFKIHSAFTSAECAEQGISPAAAITTVAEAGSGDGCLSITDTVTGDTAKAEAEYVSEYYDELHLSRVSITLTLRDIGDNVNRWRRYHSPAMGRDFYIQSLERDLQAGTASVTMKEIW